MENGRAARGLLGGKLRVPRVRGMRRERLEAVLDQVWQHRLGLVVGPAGSGKTTLLAQFAARASGPVAWYRADSHDASSPKVLAQLERCLCGSLDGLNDNWEGIDDAVRALEDWPGDGALLVMDDLHVLDGTPAELIIARLVDDLPPALAVILASRQPPRCNLSRLRVSDALVELGPDDLRFRAWEVERLFRDFYDERLSPEDFATLARRTEGWAAGLQLFHLATRDKPPCDRHAAVASLASGSRLVREYLAQNVVDELPADLRDFLFGTCVLGRLTGSLCDEVLGRSDSDTILAELERRQVFTTALDDAGTYRYHEVLRAHLEIGLVARLGEESARERYARAGQLLENAGALPEALRAYGRAEEWESATRLLRHRGEEVIDEPPSWIEFLPATLVESDPWLLMATARRQVAAGCWQSGMDAYRRAERCFAAATGGADIARRERMGVATWLEPLLVAPIDWNGIVRLASDRDPLAAMEQSTALPGAAAQVAGGLAALLAGSVVEARSRLTDASQRIDASPILVLGAQVGLLVTSALGGTPPDPRQLERLTTESEVLGLHWVACLVRSLLALSGSEEGVAEAAKWRLDCETGGDRWGAAMASLLEGMGGLRSGAPAAEPLECAVEGFRQLHAGVLEAWARSALAAARASATDAGALATAYSAERFARTVSAPGAQAVAQAALGRLDHESGAEHRRLAWNTAAQFGLSIGDLMPSATDAPAAEAGDGTPESGLPNGRHRTTDPSTSMKVRCFGEFELTIAGQPVECSTVKPRVRSLLHLLAVHLGHLVHREVIVESLWPSIDPSVGMRNLHVAVSTLRHLLEPGVTRGASSLVLREGDAYRLNLPADADVDLASFETALGEARLARGQSDRNRARVGLRRALDVYAGDLLPEEGAAEWVTAEREQYRMKAAEAAQRLAEDELWNGEIRAVAEVCERGLGIDRYRDSLWRLRIEAYERSGDHAAAATTRRSYERVLAELGVG